MRGYLQGGPEKPSEIVLFLFDQLKDTDWPYRADYCGRCSPPCVLGHYCESCGSNQQDSHKPGCAAAATLKRIETLITTLEAKEEEEACSSD